MHASVAAALVVAVAAQSVLFSAAAPVIPLTGSDHREIETLYVRTLHEAESTSGLRHWLTNFLVEPTPDGAVAWPYVVQGRGIEMKSAALYRDRLAKGPEGWHIVRREEFPGTTMPPREHYAAPSNESANTFTARDYAEIKRLVTRYNLGYDNAGPYDGGVLSSLSFTLDGLFERPGGATRNGREGAIAQAKEFQTKPGLHHWDSNFLIDVSPTGEVTAVDYDMQFNVNGDGSEVNLRGGGILTHRFVRTAEGWLIKYRRYDGLGAVPKVQWPAPAYGLTAAAITLEPGERGGGGALTSADYVEIDQLYARSNFAFDSAAEEGAAFARTFVADGSLLRDGVKTTGQRAIAALAAVNRPSLHSWMSNLVVEPAGDGATGRAYVVNLTSGGKPPVNDVGRFDDQLMRTRDGWRFKSRAYVSAANTPRQ